jgi:pyrimidine-nucleoside phosphorylase
MSFADVIARKRDGSALRRDDIVQFVSGVLNGSVPDYQASALLMAIALRGMDAEETAWLTDAMLESGARIDLSALPGVKVGKHSTGGVGDKLSLVVVPLVAACGVVMPKMSGRGLGHTGGTLDKLESIPGFRVDVTPDDFVRMLRATGAAIIGQSAALVPADRELYALRDVTATVESVPLIAASIMSKKLAEGSTALVLDVKCGRGALMATEAGARELAGALVALGRRFALPTEALITGMDAPLGRAVGNAVEVAEAIDLLKGGGPDDVRALAEAVGGAALRLSGQFDADSAAAAIRQAIASGAGFERLRAIVAQQGGDPRVLDDPGRLPGASERVAVTAPRPGHVAGLDAAAIGRASVCLGAGRARRGDPVDHGAGVLVHLPVGAPVRAGETVLTLLTNDRARIAAAEVLAREAITIADTPPDRPPLVRDVIPAGSADA